MHLQCNNGNNSTKNPVNCGAPQNENTRIKRGKPTPATVCVLGCLENILSSAMKGVM